MSQYDFLNFLNRSEREELLKMTSALITDEYKKHIVLSQPETLLNEIRTFYDLPVDYEIGEKVHRLNSVELMELIDKKLSSKILIDELNGLSPETKNAFLHYKRNEEKRKCNEKIKAFFKERFRVKINGQQTPENFPKHINIREIHGNSVVFDFYVKKGEQEVTFNEDKLHEANHFFLLWLGDFDGFEDSERFRQLYAINATSLIPFMDELYLYDSVFWDGTEVCGILNNQGDIVLPSRFSQIERVGISEYFKANRLKLHGELEGEGWEYYDKNGKRVNGELVEGEVDEKYEIDLQNKYKFVREIIWTQQELNVMKTIGQRKFSKWFVGFDELKDLTEAIVIDFKTLYRNPNTKQYLIKDLYVSFSNLNGKEMVGVGIDPDMNIEFNPNEE